MSVALSLHTGYESFLCLLINLHLQRSEVEQICVLHLHALTNKLQPCPTRLAQNNHTNCAFLQLVTYNGNNSCPQIYTRCPCANELNAHLFVVLKESKLILAPACKKTRHEKLSIVDLNALLCEYPTNPRNHTRVMTSVLSVVAVAQKHIKCLCYFAV